MARPRARTAATRRRALAGVLMACAAAVALAAQARAATLPSTCTELTAKIAAAYGHPNHGAGDVIVLDGMCEAGNLKTSAGVPIPPEANFSIEGAPGTTSGFDGTGVTAPMLHNAGFEAAGTMTLRNLTFRHADVTASAGGALRLVVAHLTLEGDSFIENTTRGGNGGAASVFITGSGKSPVCASAPAPAGLTIVASTFRANKLVASSFGAGGALAVGQACAFPESVLEGDTFEGNSIEYGGSGEALGGAVSFEIGGSELPTPVIQRTNVFDSNRVTAPSTVANFGGGGEWLEGASLTSVGDRFSRNAIPGTSAPGWSWGGGLGILNTNCNAVTATESSLQNAVVAGNAIGAGTPGALGGAGIYVGCSPSSTHPNHLALLDSTVTENTVPAGGVAGVDGNPGDQLRIANSIVAGDSGGSETGGFSGPGGSLGASFSDVCAPGGASALPGEGNICADPRLADDGNAASVDVHETTASPTIDAGSNALVPAGLATDVFGGPRIVAATVRGTCGGPLIASATVDMGAAEAPAGMRTIPLGVPCPILARRSSFTFPSIAQGVNGLLTLTFKGLAAGRITVKATYRRTRVVLVKVKGHRRKRRRTETLPYAATVTASVPSPRTLKLKLKPTARALKLLARVKRLPVQLSITFTQPGLLASTQSRAITVRYRAPRRRKHRR